VRHVRHSRGLLGRQNLREYFESLELGVPSEPVLTQIERPMSTRTIRFISTALFTLICCGACQDATSSGTGPSDGATVDDVAIDGSDDASPDSEVDGRYHQGPYLCCAPGEDRACCVGQPQGTCFRYGGVLGACVKEGSTRSPKDTCEICCDGLSNIFLTIDDAGTCESNGPPDIFYCAACGDGICGVAENRCNCPADCP
jgi:hypothetical protein